ncbi:MAG TPA: PIN domain-containing protein [Thermoanaerobaculia bacterium]|nr:PIN domain-containing protein [Thermoanaerobaculia bacterium]
MATLTYLDTHVVAWLFAGELALLPKAVRLRLEEGDLVISPMVTLELQFLFEIRRVTRPGLEVVAALAAELGLRTCDLPFPQVVARAAHQSWTRDPFDRLITAQAALREAPLLTKDGDIHTHYPHAVWSG